LILTATIGITFSLQARFVDQRAVDALLRIVIAAFALVVLLHPDRTLAIAACVPVWLLVGYWIARRRNVALAAPAGAGAG
jgi:hypothetical protein